MNRCLFALVATIVLASSSGCCCVERFWVYGCGYHGEFGPYYGYEGPDADRYCNGYCSNCAEVGRRDNSGNATVGATYADAEGNESTEPEVIDGIPQQGDEPMKVEPGDTEGDMERELLPESAIDPQAADKGQPAEAARPGLLGWPQLWQGF